MTRKLVLVALALLASVLAAQAAGVHPKGPQPQGFTPFGWGQPIPSGRDVEVVESDGRTLFLRLPNRQIRIGEADIMDALYGFRDNKFYAAVLTFRGFTQYRRLRFALETMHGSADDEDNYAKHYIWRWEDVQVRLTWNMGTGYGNAVYIFLPLAEDGERDG
ncbi:hypothetical protein [Desulfocurvibacter africanus]|uniref:Lipoprotein n=1 Tax=Desulfocurvibacter africanus subsp. africanus str. Walvis Bay TaxID=690850 RepID=F3Z2Y5_DESAF|nr:hypothetical protein [Desulfocurvibacter africanus]EGJ51393.1 hypothetical protein Desaf_3096 [Desulfocurvibacter africanus subsp. africanus str. Walvis Bay]